MGVEVVEVVVESQMAEQAKVMTGKVSTTPPVLHQV